MTDLRLIGLLVAFAVVSDLYTLHFLRQRRTERERREAEQQAERERLEREAQHEASEQMRLPFSGPERRNHERRESGQEAAHA